jgi:FAD:protein FMN transferase
MTSCLVKIERARPLLGTTVAIRVHGLQEAVANCAIDEAFGEVALIHRLMSFHEPTSDVRRLNRDAHQHAVEVHPATLEVLNVANDMSFASEGAFDITIAPRLVAAGVLPNIDAAPADPAASWHDIEIAPHNRIRFHRSLWIDLGGIAKGFAVDRATKKLKEHGAVQGCVNAGGDLVVFGPDSERVALRIASAHPSALPVLEVENAAVASSSSEEAPGVHLDGRTKSELGSDVFASVIADSCIEADALTKVVLALKERCQPMMQRYRAAAHLYDAAHGWRHFGA